MDEITKIKLIDDYLLGRLNQKERDSFESQLASDNQLKEEVSIRSIMVDQIETIGDLKMKDRILKIQSKVEAKPKVIGRRRFLTIAIAAAASVLLLLVGNRLINGEMTPAKLYAQNYEAYDLKFGSRSDDQDKQLIDAGALYRNGEYSKALPLFEEIEKAGNGSDQITLAKAICNLELENYEEAISILKQPSAQQTFLFHDQVRWYSALAYLKLEKLTESKICSRVWPTKKMLTFLMKRLYS